MALVRRDFPDFQDMFQRFFEVEPDRSMLRVEEFIDDKTLVVRAEIPDIDPDKDVDLSVEGGRLHIKAQREARTEHKDKHSYRSEFRYGSFTRSIPLPEGATEADITASYKDGVLEVRVPIPEPKSPEAKKIPIRRE
jgi:HSP20 family protein